MDGTAARWRPPGAGAGAGSWSAEGMAAPLLLSDLIWAIGLKAAGFGQSLSFGNDWCAFMFWTVYSTTHPLDKILGFGPAALLDHLYVSNSLFPIVCSAIWANRRTRAVRITPTIISLVCLSSERALSHLNELLRKWVGLYMHLIVRTWARPIFLIRLSSKRARSME